MMALNGCGVVGSRGWGFVRWGLGWWGARCGMRRLRGGRCLRGFEGAEMRCDYGGKRGVDYARDLSLGEEQQ